MGSLSVLGVVLQLAYRLRRHFCLGWSLARWLGLLLVIAALVMLIRWWPYLWPAGLLAGLLLLHIVVLIWASRRGYVRFVVMPEARTLLHDMPPDPPLRVEELVPLRASGWFTVEGKDQYYVDLAADFETVGTREHIVLARVYPSRFLLLGNWPEYELGWWYIFFQPAMIHKIAVGHLHFGPRSRLAIQVVYTPDEQTQQTIYFTFDGAEALNRVWDDLLRDAPSKALA
jgi:hypothetical protein